MKSFSLALRNLLRNNRRSSTTILAMAIGVLSVLTFGGYSGNIRYGLETGFIQENGQFQILKKGYFDFGSGNPTAYGIAHYDRIIEAVRHDNTLGPMLAVITPSLSLGGIAGNSQEGVSRTIVSDGVVAADVNAMHKWNEYHYPYTYRDSPLTGTSADSAYIGTGVARVLLLCKQLEVKNCPAPPADESAAGAAEAPADIEALASRDTAVAATAAGNEPTMELLTSTGHGAPNIAELKVVKAQNMGMKSVDDMYVGMHLAQAQKLIYGSDEPRVTSVVVQLHHTRDMPVARARIQQLLDSTFKAEDLEVRDFAELSPSFGQTIGLFKAIFGFIFILIGTIVLFLVGNTMSMSVVERTVEIGTLRSMGVKRRGIKWLFIQEATLLGIMGTVLGIVLSLGLAWLINHSHLTWTPPGKIDPVPLTIRVWGDLPLILSTFITLVVVALVSAWIPSGRASRMNIVDALRHA